jgi:CheY-like chemotaxis protein
MTNKKYKKLFVVDDDEVHNFVTQRLVLQFDNEYEVVSFLSPVKALEALKSAQELPGIILLDINMPEMDGFEFLSKMKDENLSDKIQVIVYSSSTYKDDKRKAKEFPNVIGYLEKPFSAEKYGEILEIGMIL